MYKINDDNLLLKFANLIKLKFLNKDDILFEQNDEPDNFYGIIQGKVSVRVKRYEYGIPCTNSKNNLEFTDYNKAVNYLLYNYNGFKNTGNCTKNNNNNYSVSCKSINTNNNKEASVIAKSMLVKEYEEIKVILGEGECFGELALINDQNRSNSIYAEQDTILFYLEKHYFNSLFKVS